MKPPTDLASVNLPLENGLPKEQSSVVGRPLTIVSSQSKILKPPLGKYNKKEQQLFLTAASAVLSNQTILNDNDNSLRPIYLTNIPDRNIFKSATSDQASISNGKDCYAFWTPSNKEAYQQLSWLPETGCVVSDTNSLNGCALNTERQSWFSITTIKPQSQNLGKISWPSFKFIVVDGTAGGGTDQGQEIVKALKLRLKPDAHQKILLKQWSGASRYTYNKVVETFNNVKDSSKVNAFKLRNRFVTFQTRHGTTNNFFSNKPWLLDCPKAIRKGAVDDAVAARKAALSNLKNGNIRHFTMRYRSKKTKTSSLTLEKTNITRNDNALSIFPKSLGDMKYCSTKQLHKLIASKHPLMDCKLQRDKFGDYYLVVPTKVKVCKPKRSGVVAIDPGVRKYLTMYSPDNQEAHFVAARFIDTIKPLLLHADNLCSRIAKSNGKTKHKLQQQLIRLRKRIHNLKTELLHKTASFITDSYSTVLMPKLDTQQIAALSTTTKYLARELNNTRHMSFFNHLKYKCLEKGVKFLHVEEYYTSQTCHKCGHLHKTSEEIHSCPSCEYVGDRDLIGALNILLKAVRPVPS
jgi:putative transposase